MPGSKWHYVLTDMEGTRIGEILNATERKYRANLSAYSTASFQVRKDNPVLPYLFNQEEDYLLQVWQDDTLRMFGPIITSNYVMAEGSPVSIAVSAADPAQRMVNRYWFEGATGVTPSTTPKANVADRLVEYQNNRTGTGATSLGIKSGNTGDLIFGGSGTYKAETGISLYTHFQNLAQGFDGFDWYIEPNYPPTPIGSNLHMPIIGLIRYANVIGENKPLVTFEHGVGKRNMRALNYLSDQTTRGNLIINISELGTEVTAANPNPYITVADESATGWRRFGLYDQIAELSGVNNVAMRTKYAEESLAVRKNKRQVLSMTSDIDDHTGRVPVFGVDYGLGDTVTANAVVEGAKLFSGLVRVYAVEVSLNDAGTATYTPILVQEGS